MSVNQKRDASVSSHHASTDLASARGDEEATDEEDNLPSLSTTEGLALRLLHPKVRSSEAEEYASYVDQYRNLNLSNELQYEQSAADMELYERAVAIPLGKHGSAGFLGVDAADEEIYTRHIRSIRFQDARQ